MYVMQINEVISEIIWTNNLNLRQITEDQFKEVFYYLKSITNNFTEITPDLILENNQYLLIFRICLGLSQKDFGEKLGTTKDWCRHTEAQRRKIIHRKVAERYTNKIQDLFLQTTIILDDALKHWNNYMFYSKDQILPEPEIRLKQISKLDEKDLENYFNLIKTETNNFTRFDVDLFKRIPQSILIFRIVLGIDHRKFAKILNINDRGLRKYESFRTWIKPQIAKKIVKSINALFSEYKDDINLEKALENFRILTGFYGNRNLKSMTNHGLVRLAKTQSIIEGEAYSLLNISRIPVERNCVVEGIKKKFNVDFVIPSVSNPKIVIESFIFKKSVKRNNWKSKVLITDHRFQALKMKNPDLITIMLIKSTERPILDSFIKKAIETEIINTDYYLINKEIETLPNLLNNLLNVTTN